MQVCTTSNHHVCMQLCSADKPPPCIQQLIAPQLSLHVLLLLLHSNGNRTAQCRVKPHVAATACSGASAQLRVTAELGAFKSIRQTDAHEPMDSEANLRCQCGPRLTYHNHQRKECTPTRHPLDSCCQRHTCDCCQDSKHLSLALTPVPRGPSALA
jgi:hypothetical protein